MENPYKVSESQLGRNIGLPLVVPLLVVAMVFIHFGYIYYYHFTADGTGIAGAFRANSYSIFLLTISAQWVLLLLGKAQTDKFLQSYPTITSFDDLENLKPVIRWNMYAALLFMPLLCISGLAGVMSVLPFEGLSSLIVMVLGIATTGVFAWAKPSEDKLKNIACTSDSLNSEVESIIHCWFHKALPNF